MTIAQNLRSLRIKLNMSQNTFGKKVGISGKAISSYETGRSIPPYCVLERINDYYGVDIFTRPEKQTKEIFYKIEQFEKIISDLKNILYETSSL